MAPPLTAAQGFLLPNGPVRAVPAPVTPTPPNRPVRAVSASMAPIPPKAQVR